jgi:C_GCAxxG_C_C family probable redox protein
MNFWTNFERMIKMKKSEKAVELFLKGYNCSQAVFGAFAEELGVSKSQALKIAAPFGGGFGRMREVCGAVSGMLMALGTVEGYDTPETGDIKAEHYKTVRELASKFEEINGSIICREILKSEEIGGTPAVRDEKYYKERPCVRCVRTASEILEEYFESKK